MSSPMTIGSIFLKIFKLVLNFIILMIYRLGYAGSFLGVGGTWNLNEEKNADAEIVASGVFVGYFIYTFVTLISYCFASKDHKHTFTDILMNVIGTMMWLATGATALHYWTGYQNEHKFTSTNSEIQSGIALGALCVISGGCYLLDTVLSVIHIIRFRQSK